MSRAISKQERESAAMLCDLAKTRERLRDEMSVSATARVVIAKHRESIEKLEAQLADTRRELEALRASPVVVPRERERLPDTREGIRWNLRVGPHPNGIGAKVDIGLFPGGRVGEVFMRLDKDHRHAVGGAMADAACTFMSICLQYGAPLPELLSKLIGAADDSGGMTYHRPNPDERVYVRDPQVPLCVSLRDYLGKKLAANTDHNGRWIGAQSAPEKEQAA